jgi:hypothetical protein
MSTFTLYQTKIVVRIIFRRFNLVSHCDMYQQESLQSFALGNDILNNRGYMAFICNVVWILTN